MVSIAETSPYIYLATTFFALSAISSDLLFIRASLASGFFFLILTSVSDNSSNGSFSKETLPFQNGVIYIPLIINGILFSLNFFICARLIHDERPRKFANDEERAIYRFFQRRSGLTQLEFHSIRSHGRFLELGPDVQVPNVDSTLYLVLEGKIECHTKFNDHQDTFDPPFFKRSGEFFDLKMFNIFTLPVGFDSFVFKATTMTQTRLYCWDVNGLIAMRDCNSPTLQPYWDLMVMRTLSNAAVRHHLKGATDTLYDSVQIPEDPAWLEGAPSRDFGMGEKPVGTCKHFQRQVKVIWGSLLRIIPPRGIRHRPGIARSAKQEYMELVSKAHTAQQFRFIPKRQDFQE